MTFDNIEAVAIAFQFIVIPMLYKKIQSFSIN